ncbi:immunity 49 family protein [Kitasatospora sp. NPDC059571]|uniref:immunity 49 family protein n=1 Tax=Kitasatospora sp. NPDC059571 TaxID=3346871 RepID=UPI003673EBB1
MRWGGSTSERRARGQFRWCRRWFVQFLQRDAAAFNEAPAEGLELHRQYWTGDEERAGDSEGFVALALLGVACLAYDAGVPVEVESAYLPRYLLERRWVGEYET